MIHYKLKDLKDITPWSNGDNQILHWFALTDSFYWFDFEGIEFPKYSTEIIKEWNQKSDSRFVDYQFARLFWDFCEVIRHVDNPVPDEVFQKVNSLEKLEMFLESLKDWIELSWDESEEQFDEIYEVAREWLYYRRLDFGYLTGGPDCFFIRNEDQIYIYWFAGYKNDKGISIWDKARGAFTYNYFNFIDSIVQNFKAFGLDMRRQISLLIENVPEDLEIDKEQILLNQSQYEELILAIERKELFYAETPDWDNILDKINEISNKII